MGKIAIVLGASGLTGKLLLNLLLEDEAYERIKIITRRALNLKHPKLQEYVVDLLQLENYKADFTGDEVFCCIGTTVKKTKDRAIYKKIDFGIPETAAKLCKENKIETFVVVSALGANTESKVFYNRTKGEMEHAVLRKKILNTYILRPSLIDGIRSEKRMGERVSAFIMKVLHPFLICRWRKYRIIEASVIACAMQALAKSKPDYKIIESDKIQEIGTYL